MKHFLGSMTNRVFLILLAGMLVAAGITRWLASNEHRKSLQDIYNYRVMERVEQTVLSLDQASPAIREAILNASESFGLGASLVNDTENAIADNPSLAIMLKTRLGSDRKITVSRQTDCRLHVDVLPNPGDLNEQERHFNDECQVVYVSLKDGLLLKLKLHMMHDPGIGHNRLLGVPFFSPYFILFLMLIALLAYMVAKMTARPLKQLAIAASELGSDMDRPPLQETGPSEIRLAATAFNAMQARIQRQIKHRSYMLAAITHDLQTPLTRLRLRLEKVSDADLRHKLLEDLAVMQDMVREGLELSRSMDSAEVMHLLDIDSLLDSICADAVEAGQDVTLQGQSQASIMAQPGALRRCLTNLLDNAVKYGRYARIHVEREESNGVHHVVIHIRDGGNGIPEAQLATVFEPFFRLETSRSRDTGGTGLGLTIARNIAENHRATLILENHPAGGLEVTLRIQAQGGS